MSVQADAIADATSFLADAIIDGADAEFLSRMAVERPMILALVADMLLHDLRSKLTEDERAIFAQALRFSVIASLTERPID